MFKEVHHNGGNSPVGQKYILYVGSQNARLKTGEVLRGQLVFIEEEMGLQ